MKVFSKRTSLIVVTLILVFAMHSSAAAPVMFPNPVLYLLGQEYFTSNGKNYTRYRFDVLNKAQYPDDLFAQAPNLPPCGTKTAARTWVDFYDQSNHRLQGFCNLGKASDLGTIYFAMESDKVPPSWVYIELNDRKTNTKYKSNLADTTL